MQTLQKFKPKSNTAPKFCSFYSRNTPTPVHLYGANDKISNVNRNICFQCLHEPHTDTARNVVIIHISLNALKMIYNFILLVFYFRS